MSVSLVEVPRTGRVPRRPQHRWYVEAVPFAIQPMMIAPVLPGETLKSGLFQSRVITDPIKNPIMGWWQEYYFFYVKLRDLHGREDFTDMLVNLEKDLSGYEEAAAPAYNHYGGTINWTKLCHQVVVENYFRDEGDAWDAYTHGGMPLAAVNAEGWTNSAALDDAYTQHDVNVDLNNDETITASEVEGAMRTWQYMRANGLTEMDYEDYLRTFGIRVAPEEVHRPELLRYIREWTYPANTVGTAGDQFGVPASAVSWAIADRLDKDRFFREPGFVVGYTVSRPKTYFGNLGGNGAGMMTDALSWLPAILKDDPWTSLKKFAQGTGPLASVVTDEDGYWVDVKDLLIYGDQFTNVGWSNVENTMALPNASLTNRWFPDGTSIDALFLDAANNRVRQDGIINLNILGAQIDTTPQMRGPGSGSSGA